MPKFVSRPVEIEAFQWEGNAAGALAFGHWVGSHLLQGAPGDFPELSFEGGGIAVLHTRSGPQRCRPGDWIIRELDGNGYYPCAREIFEAKYQAIV